MPEQRDSAGDGIYLFADAFAAVWSASRILAGTAERLPDEDRFDSTGVLMRIWA